MTDDAMVGKDLSGMMTVVPPAPPDCEHRMVYVVYDAGQVFWTRADAQDYADFLTRNEAAYSLDDDPSTFQVASIVMVVAKDALTDAVRERLEAAS